MNATNRTTIYMVASWALGVALGSIATQRALAAQYERMTIQEIASAREFYKDLYGEKDKTPDDKELRERKKFFFQTAVSEEEVTDSDSAEKIEAMASYSQRELEEDPEEPEPLESEEAEEDTEMTREAALALTNYAGISVGKSSLEQEKEIVASRRKARTGKKVIPSDPPAPVEENHIPSASDIEARAKDVLKETDSLKNYKRPYVIDFDTYKDSASEGYEQVVLEYYKGDEVFTDYADMVVSKSRIKQVIGLENLEKFGLVSNLPDVLHVRCEQFKMDFEINRSNKKYSVEVLGEADE